MKKILILLLMTMVFVTGCFQKAKENEVVERPLTIEETTIVEQTEETNETESVSEEV